MSRTIMSLQEAESFLLGYSPEKSSGETYTLERMKLLMERLDNPQNKLRSLHVAGTSGKTSTSYHVRALLEAHGQRTGLTSSPHIVSVAERVQVGGRPLDDKVFLAYLNEFLQIIEPWSDIEPSYFELLIALAFWIFEREQVDYMIIEVGLGGLLDATNVITRPDKVSIITPIGLDHTTVLGNTVEEITIQKAGIILPETDVFSASQAPTVTEILRTTSRNRNSRLRIIDSNLDASMHVPVFQQENFALALTAVEFIAVRDSLDKISEVEKARCMDATPPGRFETYEIGDKTLILDGAHNPQKISAFVSSLRLKHPEPITWLLGFIEAPDSKIDACLQEVLHDADDYIFTQFKVSQDIKGRKSVDAEILTRYDNFMNGAKSVAEKDALKALELLLLSKKRTIVVTGSLYLVALLRPTILELAT